MLATFPRVPPRAVTVPTGSRKGPARGPRGPRAVDPDAQRRLLARLRVVQAETPMITTIAEGRPNWIVSVDERGVRVETEGSREKGSAGQLIPAWMFAVAWEHLSSHGSLHNRYLVATSGLSVKRSSPVCALLARLPGVTVVSSRPIELRYTPV